MSRIQTQKGEEMKTQYILALLVLLSLSGCADTVPVEYQRGLVGFLHGWWHGIIIFFAFIGSLFSDNIAIYAVYNNGGWYDFGYVIGIGSLSSISITL